MTEDSSVDVNELLEEVQEAVGQEVDRSEVEQEVQRFREFSVTGEELVRAVRNKFGEKYDVDITGNGSSGVTPFSELQEDEWYDIEATVVSIFEDTHDSIAQKGYIDDGEERIIFTIFENSDGVPLLNEGWSYRFESVPCEMFNGNPQVNITSTTDVTQLEEDIEPSDQTIDVVAPIVDFAKGGTGIYAVDPETGEKVDSVADVSNPEYRLRLMPIIDTGTQSWTISAKGEVAESLYGDTTQAAVEDARSRIGESDAIYSDMMERYIGTYVRVTGDSVGDDTISASSIEVENRDPTEELESLLVEIRTLAADHQAEDPQNPDHQAEDPATPQSDEMGSRTPPNTDDQYNGGDF